MKCANGAPWNDDVFEDEDVEVLLNEVLLVEDIVIDDQVVDELPLCVWVEVPGEEPTELAYSRGLMADVGRFAVSSQSMGNDIPVPNTNASMYNGNAVQMNVRS